PVRCQATDKSVSVGCLEKGILRVLEGHPALLAEHHRPCSFRSPEVATSIFATASKRVKQSTPGRSRQDEQIVMEARRWCRRRRFCFSFVAFHRDCLELTAIPSVFLTLC